MEVFQLPLLTYVLWCDKREVSVLSNCHSRVNMVETGKQDPQFKPDVVQEYNMNMGGLDLVDQVTKGYPSMQKTIKWCKKLFLLWWILLCIIALSYGIRKEVRIMCASCGDVPLCSLPISKFTLLARTYKGKFLLKPFVIELFKSYICTCFCCILLQN